MTARLCTLIAVAAIAGAAASPARADTLQGRWDATVTLGDTSVPFRLDIAVDGERVVGSLFNGTRPFTSTAARREGGTVTIEFEHYLTKIVATLQSDGRLEGTLEGRFDRSRYISGNPFQAVRHVPPAPVAVSSVPSIDGEWEIPYESAKGEKAWRLIVTQRGAEASAAILRIDGDTGELTGRYAAGAFRLSHFDGSRPLVLTITPGTDDTLALSLKGAFAPARELTARRPEAARASGLAAPSDAATHTTVRDANEPFRFAFPDLDGRVVTSDDPRFKGKAIIAVVTGTWCPNCHDEAQYLVQLDARYRDRGLAIVALTFEEPEQQDELTRARAFVKKYGVNYTYLLAGAPAEMWEKVPQAVNLNTWPATFFIGRDGLVKAVHAGFASPASGIHHEQLKQRFTSIVEKLLDEPAPATADALLEQRPLSHAEGSR